MIQGEIHILPLPDLIQWLALTRRTGKLVLRQVEQSLELYFIKGEIAGGTDEALIAIDSAEKVHRALGRALARRAGRFAFSDDELPKWVASINLRLSAESTLYNLFSELHAGRPPSARSYLDNWTEAGKDFGLFTPDDALRLQVIDQLLKENFNVPAMPQLAARVLELTRAKNFSLRELGNLVLTDQAVAARVLRYANSARQGTEQEVTSLAQAVQRLGADEVVSIVLAAALQAHKIGRELFAAEKHRLWVYSSTAAFCARALAPGVGLERNLGFLCGLLMDFGRNVLYNIIQDLLSQGTNTKPISKKLIKKIVRDYHPSIGRVVGEKWKLPVTVIEVMAYHHCLEEAPSKNPYVAVAALADYLTNFALSTLRTELEAALADFPPERLVEHPAARILNLRTPSATTVLSNLPSLLDQALEFVAR